MFKFEAPVIIYLFIVLVAVISFIRKIGTSQDYSILKNYSNFQIRFMGLIVLSIFIFIQIGLFAWGGFFAEIEWPQIAYFITLGSSILVGMFMPIKEKMKVTWKHTVWQFANLSWTLIILYYGGFFTYQ